MKRAFFILTVIFAFTGVAGAQQIRTSPFEGRWVWDGRGDGIPYFTELTFFGDVMLGTDDGYPLYEGEYFTYTARLINFEDFDTEWEYRISGNTLTVTTEDYDRFTYTRTGMGKSPMEGIWKVTGGSDFNDDADQFMLFTGDIMALSDAYGYMGFKIDFSGRSFHPSRSYFRHVMGKEISESELRYAAMEYGIYGNSMIISQEGHAQLMLTRVY